jgi:hypothetical protein
LKITPELLRDIASSEGLGEDDRRLVSILITFVHFVSDPESNGDHNWDDAKMTILENSYLVLHELKNFSDNVQNRRIQGSQVAHLKELFISVSSNENPELIDPI